MTSAMANEDVMDIPVVVDCPCRYTQWFRLLTVLTNSKERVREAKERPGTVHDTYIRLETTAHVRGWFNDHELIEAMCTAWGLHLACAPPWT